MIGKLNPGQQVVKIVSDELTEMMGGEQRELSFSPRPPTVVLMAGLQGSGKTTAAAKLARYLPEEHGSSVALAACDVYRPAAVDSWSRSALRPAPTSTSRAPTAIRSRSPRWARERAPREGKDVLIVDTSGRLHIDERADGGARRTSARPSRPHDVLLVVDAMTGQDAVNVAEQFARGRRLRRGRA